MDWSGSASQPWIKGFLGSNPGGCAWFLEHFSLYKALIEMEMAKLKNGKTEMILLSSSIGKSVD